MRLKALALSAIAIAACTASPVLARAPAQGAKITAPKIAYTRWVLPNGLTVIAIPDTATSTVTTSVWYGVGSKHDPEGRSGFAHLFEHILSRKTENMPYNMINRLTEDVGGIRNASTGDDRTNYYEIVPAQYLETLLWTHAERMARPVVDSEVFERERSIVKEELRQRVLAQPYGRLMRFVIPENSFDVLPLRRSGIGSIAQLDAANLDDARGFHQAYYGPDTATLIVAGNFELKQLKAQVARLFGPIPRRARPQPLAVTAKEPPRTAMRRVEATAPGVPLPVVGASWKLPGAGHPDRAALEVLDMVLTGGDNSRMYRALVESGKAVSVSEYVDLAREGGSFVGFAMVSAGQEPEAVATAMQAEYAKVLADGVTPAELAEARNELLAGALRERETAQGRAFELGEALMGTGDPAAADKRLAAIGKVTTADVLRVARTYLKPETRLELRYSAGPDDPAKYANPAPMPKFTAVPSPTGSPALLKPEGQRQAPPAPGAVPPLRQPVFAESTLGNGVKVIAAQTGAVPVASLTVLLPGGSASDPRDKAGIAAFAAGLANKGTATRSAQEIAARFESLGATFSAAIDPDGVRLGVSAPVAQLEAAGEVLADLVQHATFPADQFETERKRGIDNFAIALKDPGMLAGLAAAPLLYGNAPYGTLANGTPQSLAKLTREDLLAHRRAWWQPARAKVLVAGGVGNAEARAMAERLFGTWRGEGTLPAPVASPAGEAQPVRTVVIDLPEAGQAAVLAAVRALPRGDADYYALALANSVLGVGSNGRLFEEVRAKRGLSYGAYSAIAAAGGGGVLSASAQTKNESAADVAKIFLDQFARLGSEPIAPEALEKRRLFLLGGNARAVETSAGFSTFAGNLVQMGVEPAEALRYAERLRAVDAGQVNAVAARIVSPDKATLLIVGNAAQFLDKLKALRSDITVIKASDLDLSSPTLGAK